MVRDNALNNAFNMKVGLLPARVSKMVRNRAPTNYFNKKAGLLPLTRVSAEFIGGALAAIAPGPPGQRSSQQIWNLQVWTLTVTYRAHSHILSLLCIGGIAI